MSEFDSLNSTDYVYEIKAQGKHLFLRFMTVTLYVLFIIAFFLFCYLTRIIPLFAIASMILYIIVLLTWRLVKYDVYWSFERGQLELGKIVKKRGGPRRIKTVSIHIKDALEIMPYEGRAQLKTAKRIYDLSESKNSENKILILFSEKEKTSAAIVEGTARLASLLTSFSKNAHDLKSRTFHG